MMFLLLNQNFLSFYRGQIYQIFKVDALRLPVMFQLKDLLGDVLKGRYYKEQLRKAPTPGVDYQFEVAHNKMGCYWLFLFESSHCEEELVFFLKCFVFCFILSTFQLVLSLVLKFFKII